MPSGLIWAKKNLGAETEEDAGLYFQWGDTVGYTAEQIGSEYDGFVELSWDNYKFSINGSGSNFSKYNKTDNKTVLDLEDDAVHVTMGGDWRMPTREDFREIINNTDLYLVLGSGEEIKGTASYYSIHWELNQGRQVIKGMKFCKKENNLIYIFIPSCGSASGDRVLYVDEYAYLWTSSIEFYPVDVSSSSVFSASGYTSGVGFNSSRYIGYPLRGVMPK